MTELLVQLLSKRHRSQWVGCARRLRLCVRDYDCDSVQQGDPGQIRDHRLDPGQVGQCREMP